MDAQANTAVTTVPTSSLLHAVPFLWSTVLFPGQAPSRTPFRWQSWLLLLILPGSLLYPCLSFRLFEPDEGRYAEIPREMLVRGDWVVPSLQSEPYLDKPPLFYWLVMLSYRTFGIHEWAARLVPAVAVHLCILMTYAFGRRHLGERGALWGAVFLALAPGFVGMGRLLILDGVLACCIALGVFAGFEAMRGRRLAPGWWLLSAVACALGILAKGPVAVVLVLPPLLCHAWLSHRYDWLNWRVVFAYLAIVAVLVSPWYVAICLRLPEFARYFLWEHNVVRFVSPFDHQRPVWFYGPILLGGLLPGTLVVFALVRYLLSTEPAVTQGRCPELGFLLLAGGWCVFFFSLSGCKLPTYILPGFPPLALALGYFASTRPWAPALKWPAGLAWLLLAVANYGLIPRYAEFHSPWSDPENVTRYCCDPSVPVVCYPRSCDSVAFYLGRDDFRSFRSKETPQLLRFLLEQPRTVILFTHRHSLEGLRQVLPPRLRLRDETPLSGSVRRLDRAETCYMAVVERR